MKEPARPVRNAIGLFIPEIWKVKWFGSEYGQDTEEADNHTCYVVSYGCEEAIEAVRACHDADAIIRGCKMVDNGPVMWINPDDAVSPNADEHE